MSYVKILPLRTCMFKSGGIQCLTKKQMLMHIKEMPKQLIISSSLILSIQAYKEAN